MTANHKARFHRTSLALATLLAIGGSVAVNATSINVGGPVTTTLASATALRSGDTITGALSSTQPIHIEVALKLRNQAQLDAFTNAASSPNAAMAQRTLTPEQFSAKHAPTLANAQAVADFLTSAGFQNVTIASNRMLVSADGTAAAAQAAFATTLVQVQTADGRVAFANNDDVHVPASLQNIVLAVLGLQTVHQAHTVGHNVVPLAVTGHNPVEFSAIYGGTGVTTAAGVTIGIITQGKITQTITDLNTFTSQNGLATVTTQTVNTNGTSTDASGVDEWNLDSQDIVGIGGGQVGKLIFYNIPTLSNANLTADFNTVVAANVTKVLNVSLGECETDAQGDGSAAAQDQIFQTGVAQGLTISVSTGDSGADECGTGGTTPSWPAASQYVIAAAGTTLNASTTTWTSETVWSGSGGSQSTFEPKPSWQTLWTGARRGVADIAFDGDPNSGAKIIVNGASTQVGGTSLSSPLFVGTWARMIAIKGTTIGFAGPLIYQLPAADFHDITSGNNGGSTAAVGYDLASGRGSMIINKVATDLGGGGGNVAPVANFSFVTNGLVATFTDSSTDSDGTIASRAWTFGDGGTSTATSPSHTYAAAGTYSVSLKVTDNGGLTNTKTSSVTVTTGNVAPVANFSFVTNGLVATFTDSSTDSDGTIASRAWTFGDGGTSTATSPSHTYAAAGTYSVSLQVTDNGGLTNTKTSSVTVTSGGGATQLLGNTGFENATASPWTLSAGVLCTNAGCTGETSHAGIGFAWLDGYGTSHTDTASQSVAITAGKTSATLSYFLHINTSETTTTTAYDTLTVGVYSTSGTLLKTLATYSNLNKNTGYTVHTNDVSAYIGQTVVIKFTGKEDVSLQTSFVLDDVTLTVQ